MSLHMQTHLFIIRASQNVRSGETLAYAPNSKIYLGVIGELERAKS